MEKTRGRHSASFRPCVRPSTPAQGTWLPPAPPTLPLLQILLIYPNWLLLPLLPYTDTRQGLGQYLLLLHFHDQPVAPPIPPFKRAQTSSPDKSSHLQPQEPPQSPPPQAPVVDNSQVHSPGSIIKRPLFHCGPIAGNSNYNIKDLHNEHFYDIPAFVALPELRDSMGLMQRYSLQPFMTPC